MDTLTETKLQWALCCVCLTLDKVVGTANENMVISTLVFFSFKFIDYLNY